MVVHVELEMKLIFSTVPSNKRFNVKYLKKMVRDTSYNVGISGSRIRNYSFRAFDRHHDRMTLDDLELS